MPIRPYPSYPNQCLPQTAGAIIDTTRAAGQMAATPGLQIVGLSKPDSPAFCCRVRWLLQAQVWEWEGAGHFCRREMTWLLLS